MLIKLIREDGSGKEYNNVLGSMGNDTSAQIHCENKVHYFTIENHVLIDRETKEKFVKMITINEQEF